MALRVRDVCVHVSRLSVVFQVSAEATARRVSYLDSAYCSEARAGGGESVTPLAPGAPYVLFKRPRPAPPPNFVSLAPHRRL